MKRGDESMRDNNKKVGMHRRRCVSGVNGRHTRARLQMARDDNRQREDRARSRMCNKEPMFVSMAGLMKGSRRR